MPGPKDDNNLLARLNALKSSTVSWEHSTTTTDVADDLTTRFLNFRRPSRNDEGKVESSEIYAGDTPAKNSEDDQTIEELLADIGPKDQWTLDPDESKDIARLIEEAKATLKEEQDDLEDGNADGDANRAKDAIKASDDLSNEAQAEAEESLKNAKDLRSAAFTSVHVNEDNTEAEEADSALQRILDELSLEKALVNQDFNVKQSKTSEPLVAAHSAKDSDHEQDYTLELPSIPDAPPISPESNHQAKGSNLDLPSTPSSKPSKKVVKSSLPTYTNDEIDTWCIICNDDATVRCSGCDGDLYCAKCWKEGHTGPDVGYEEKMHRWAKYVKPK